MNRPVEKAVLILVMCLEPCYTYGSAAHACLPSTHVPNSSPVACATGPLCSGTQGLLKLLLSVRTTPPVHRTGWRFSLASGSAHVPWCPPGPPRSQLSCRIQDLSIRHLACFHTQDCTEHFRESKCASTFWGGVFLCFWGMCQGGNHWITWELLSSLKRILFMY